MKKIYKKPLIMVEELTLDHAIAANCDANREIMDSMIEWGYFGIERTCDIRLYEKEGVPGLWQDMDGDGVLEDSGWGDTVCYHSSIGVAFLS